MKISPKEMLGNIELLNSFLTMHYLTFGYQENEFDKRLFEPNKISYQILSDTLQMPIREFEFQYSYRKPTREKNIQTLYEEYLEEAIKRNLQYKQTVEKKDIIYTKEFETWFLSMKNRPMYIREVTATNYLGDNDISYADDEYIGFDYPVRKSCNILYEKGYHTYWSSANEEDYRRRKSHVIKDKRVAYILIDSNNLDKNLKEQLVLNGDCDFWGIASSYNDNGKYYGIYTEIQSLNEKCEEVSKRLIKKSEALPSLKI